LIRLVYKAGACQSGAVFGLLASGPSPKIVWSAANYLRGTIRTTYPEYFGGPAAIGTLEAVPASAAEAHEKPIDTLRIQWESVLWGAVGAVSGVE